MIPLPFKVVIQAVCTVTNPPIEGKALESLKDRYRRGLPDLEGYALAPEIKRAIDAEKESEDGAHR